MDDAPCPVHPARPAFRPGVVNPAALAGAVVAVAMVGIGVGVWRVYGAALFLLTPLLMGLVVGILVRRAGGITRPESVAVLLMSFILAAFGLLLVAAEGIVCLLMSVPVSLPMALGGAEIGRWLVERGRSTGGLRAGLMLVPLVGGVESALPTHQDIHVVESVVEIDAPPEVVWNHVLAFPALPEPREWYFRAGLAYPLEARIDGAAVGATRYCVFSTGAFVEPITAWEPGRRLAFDVASAPPPLRELSPYNDVHPPHLKGFLNTKRGEFVLVALPGGRTRLEGRTWYSLDMSPGPYWRWITEMVIHRIHGRVLEHIRQQAQQVAGSDRPASRLQRSAEAFAKAEDPASIGAVQR